MPEQVACPECGENYENLGQHWWGSPDHRPELTRKQRDIVTGLMMGDASLNRLSGQNPRIILGMITPAYLQHLDSIFGTLSCGVSLKHTAAESAAQQRRSGGDKNADEKDYSDVYQWVTRNNPELSDWDWYTEEKGKVFPSDIVLTPTVLKHWFVGDGNRRNQNVHSSMRISSKNEISNTDKIDEMFSRASLPKPTYSCTDITFTVPQSRKLWEYMGSPPPGFEYKWPEEYR